MKYKAFISYRHCELDSEAAKKIIKAVETYGIPKTIAEKHHIDKHVGKLFRDEDELAAAANLSVVITEALDDSEYLIMVCSPRYVESEWCMLEVQHWINRNGRKNIITVLADGEPNEAFPKILTDYTENGKPVHIEPLAVDIRGASRKEVLKNIDIQKFRIISSLIGCDYDDLRQRQQERAKRNTIGIFSGVFSVFALIVAIILVSNVRLNDKNIELEELHGSLEEIQAELDSKEKEIDDKSAEIKAKEDSLAELNISIINKMAEIDMFSENRIAASARKLLAYKTAEESGLDTSDTFNELIEYSDMYNTDLAKKVKSTSTEKNNYDLKCGNSRYFQVDGYFYDVLKNEPVYNLRGDYLYIPDKYLTLEGSKFAYVDIGHDIHDNDSPYELTVRVFDISDGSEKEYKYEFADAVVSLDDYFTDNGNLIVYTRYYKELISYYDFFVFDYDCNLKDHYSFTSEEIRLPRQLLSSETFLCADGIYNFVTGEKTTFENFDISNYFSKNSNKNKVYSEYDFDAKSYIFSERNYQYVYAALFGDYVAFNDNFGTRGSNIFLYDMKTNKLFKFFDENIDRWKLRFSVSDSGSVLAGSDDEEITLINKNLIMSQRSCSGNIKKLVVGDNYLVVLYYDENPEVIYFDYETMDFIKKESNFERNYDDVLLCGNVLHMYSKDENLVDTYYLNDFSGYKAMTVPKDENEKYDLFSIDYSIGDNFAVIAYNNVSEYVKPMLYIFDSNNGKLLGNFEVPDEFVGMYESSSGEMDCDCHPIIYDGYIGGDYYINDNKETYYLYLVNYKDLLNSDDSAESHIIDINNYECSIYGNVAYITQWHSDGTDFEYNSEKKDHGTFSGVVYNLAEGKLIEEVEFYDKKTSDFYIYENVRVESGDYGIRIYDGDKLVNSFNANTFYPCNDPSLIIMFDNDRWVIFSLSKNKEMISVESDKKLSFHSFGIEENGGNHLLFEYRYLVDTEKFEIIHDFGDNSPIIDIRWFVFNEYLGMWEFGVQSGLIFCYPDTFEKAFSVDGFLILSPNGKYFYDVDRFKPQKSDESRALWQIPILKEEEAAENIEKMLNDFGITEDEIKALDTM